MSCGTSRSSASAASSIRPDFGRSAIWPICETSNRPAAVRVCRCSLSTPVGILHRHVIAGERHHLAAAADMQRRARGCVSVADSAIARKHQGPSRLIGNEFPEKPVEAPSVAVPESIIPSADASGRKPLGVSFQMSSSHAVRLPESFRGGCSFGAGVKAGLSRRDCLEQIGTEHGGAKPVNAAAASIHGLCADAASP